MAKFFEELAAVAVEGLEQPFEQFQRFFGQRVVERIKNCSIRCFGVAKGLVRAPLGGTGHEIEDLTWRIDVDDFRFNPHTIPIRDEGAQNIGSTVRLKGAGHTHWFGKRGESVVDSWGRLHRAPNQWHGGREMCGLVAVRVATLRRDAVLESRANVVRRAWPTFRDTADSRID